MAELYQHARLGLEVHTDGKKGEDVIILIYFKYLEI